MRLACSLQYNAFVGRVTEISEISGLLVDSACRLLTLVGPGGIGKTRLALEVCQQNAALFPDGVYIVYLQPLSSSEFIISTITDALELQIQVDTALEQLVLNHLYDKTLLLMLDNFEHLLDGNHIVRQILAETRDVKILTTSRERLNLREEWVYEVNGLDYPINDDNTPIEKYGATQLFIQNARRASTTFRLTAENIPAVSRICRLVGGMPLGIELVSTWVRVLTCDDIAQELAHGLDILETSLHNVEARHRTMRAAFEPTWNRLSEDERNGFMKLSVFRGGFTRAAAEFICGASLNILSALIGKSLVQSSDNGRYGIHELLRQYGEEKLSLFSPDIQEQTHNLHRIYYLQLLSECETEIVFLGQQKAAIAKINNDLENVRIAWQRAVEQGCFEEILQATEGLWDFY